MLNFIAVVFLVFSALAGAESYPLLNATPPIQYSQMTGTISILTANGTQAGALSAANWTVFNNKQNALTFGNLLSGTTGVTIGTGTGRLVGGNATVSIQIASGSQPGLLSAADWTTFNSKSPPITKGNLTTTTVGVTVGNGTQSVIGSGTTVNIATASGSQPGLLSGTDWTTFNSKQDALTLGALSSSTPALTVTGGTGAVVGSGTSLAIAVANSSQTGLISAADWTTFNNKQSTITTGNFTSPAPAISITGGTNAVLGSGTVLNIANATASMTGLLSYLDWQAFNAKQAALTFGNLSTSTSAITITGGTGAVVGSGTAINIPTANGAQTGLLSAANWTTFSNKAPLNSPTFTGTPGGPSYTFYGSSAGALVVTVPSVVTNYTIRMPPAQGAAGTCLTNNGSGILSWGTCGSGGSAPQNTGWTKYTYNYSDFSDPGTTKTITIAAGNKTVVQGVVVGVVTPFNTAGSAVYITLGTDTTSVSELTSGIDVFAAAAGDTQSVSTVQEVGTYSAESITITAEIVDDVLSSMTAGQIEVWIATATLP